MELFVYGPAAARFRSPHRSPKDYRRSRKNSVRCPNDWFVGGDSQRHAVACEFVGTRIDFGRGYLEGQLQRGTARRRRRVSRGSARPCESQRAGAQAVLDPVRRQLPQQRKCEDVFIEAPHRRHVAHENDGVVDRTDGAEGGAGALTWFGCVFFHHRVFHSKRRRVARMERSGIRGAVGENSALRCAPSRPRTSHSTSSGHGTIVDFTVFIAMASLTACATPSSVNG